MARNIVIHLRRLPVLTVTVWYIFFRELDPIFALSTAFRKHEQNSVNKKILVRPANYDCAHVEQLLRHTVQSARNARLASSAEIAPHLLAAIERTDDFEELEKSKRPRKSSIEDDDCNLPGNSTKSFEENPVSATIEEGLFQDLPGEFVRQRIADCTSATNAEPFCWTPAASNGVQPVGVPPWYLNGIRLGGVGPPQVPTVGGALLFPAKTHTDLWWNSVDSQTWLMGLQNYLLLHSLSGLGLRLQWIRPPPSLALNGLSSVGAGWPNTCNIGPRFVSNAAASQFAPPQPSSLPMGCSFADVCNAPNQSPTVGSSAPAADLNVPGVYLRKRESPTVDKSSPGEVDRSSRRSHHSVINLVNFMHNYCIPQSQVAAATSSLPVDCRVSPSGGSDRELVVDGQSSNYGQTSPCSGIDVGFSKEIRPVRKCCPSSSADASSVSGLRLNLSPAAAANSSAAAPSACHGGDPVESDSDSAVACTTGSGSSLRSTPSASSTLTENWLDDCSSSQSPSSTDAAYGPAPVATARKSIDSAVEIASAAAIDDEDEMTTPGWFGKGVGMKRLKKRRYRRDSR